MLFNILRMNVVKVLTFWNTCKRRVTYANSLVKHSERKRFGWAKYEGWAVGNDNGRRNFLTRQFNTIFVSNPAASQEYFLSTIYNVTIFSNSFVSSKYHRNTCIIPTRNLILSRMYIFIVICKFQRNETELVNCIWDIQVQHCEHW